MVPIEVDATLWAKYSLLDQESFASVILTHGNLHTFCISFNESFACGRASASVKETTYVVQKGLRPRLLLLLL